MQVVLQQHHMSWVQPQYRLFIIAPIIYHLLTLQVPMNCFHCRMWFHSYRIKVVWQHLPKCFLSSFPLVYGKGHQTLDAKISALITVLPIKSVKFKPHAPLSFTKQEWEGWKLKSQYSTYLIVTLITRFRHNIIPLVYLWLASYDTNQTELTKKISCQFSKPLVTY